MAVVLGGVTAVSAPDLGAADAPVVVVPTTIDSTGSADVTDQLSAFLAGVAPGSTVMFQPNGQYRIEGVVTLLNEHDLVIDGNGATLFATTDGSTVRWPRSGFKYHWPRRREQLDIRNGFNITVRNLTIEGANPDAGPTAEAYDPTLEGQAGIGISRSAWILLDSITINDTYGDFVWVTGNTNVLTIRNSTFARSGRQGIALVSAQGVVIENNSISDVARSVIDLEPLGAGLVQNVHVQNNQVGEYRGVLLAAGGGGLGVNDVWLESNSVDGGHGVSVAAGHLVRQRHGYHILNNTGTGAVTAPGTGHPGIIQLTNLDAVEVRGNSQGVAGGPAIWTGRVCNLVVSDNQFPGADDEVVSVADCPAPPSV
jgi:hypothetical protein